MGNENGYDDGGGANGNGNGVNGSANGHGTSTSFHGNGGNGKNTGKLSNHEYISEKEIENMKQQFQLLDADGSGTLDHEEFIQLGRKAGLPLDKLEQLILVVDKNHDGVISFSEFVSGDVIYEVRKLIGEQRALARKELLLKESRTHVNILKLLQVVRLKIENSKRAYEFGAYLIFLLVYCVAVLMQRAPFQSMMLSASLSNYFIGSAYRVPYANELKDFMGIRTTQEFWDWHQIHFLGLFYVQNYYNGDLYDRIDQGNILVHIRKTGGFRLVQRRAENGSCWSSKAYQQFQSDCYGYTYADGMVGPTDEKPFYGAMSKKEYKFEQPTWFDFGYYEIFGENQTKATMQMQRLRDDLWIDKGTQFTRLDFVVYNPNIGQFAIVNLQCTYSVTGLITPSVSISSRRFGYYQTNADWVRFACEVFLLIAWALYVFAEVKKFRHAWETQERVLAHFDVFWHQADAAHFTIFFITACIWIYIVADPSVLQLEVSETTITMDGQPINFQTTVMAVEVYFAMSAINMLLAVVRLLRFLRMNAFLGQLTDALEMMKDGLVQFLFVLILVIFIFTAMGIVLFGGTLAAFAQPLLAVDEVLGYAMGFADPYELFAQDPTGATVFFYPFVFIMTLFVLPLTIAIIMDGYTAMQEMLERALKSNLSQAVTLTFPEQVYRGLVRSMQLLIPNHESHSRLKYPPKDEILNLFSDCEEYEIMTLSELHKRFQDKSITEEMLNAIIERYEAFQPDPDWIHLMENQTNIEAMARIEATEQENNDPAVLAVVCDDLDTRLDQLINDQAVMCRKLDLLLDIFPTATQAQIQ
mmetsp:Transcript_46808/g.111441  ORF Transcript_46808/g.111441 Transcript_46808/m.111441 type:complete len:812 (-) Transcript_46808:151-2586(-)